ncbi:TPA: SpoV family signaling peptide, partial [Streptococcus pyogenes]
MKKKLSLFMIATAAVAGLSLATLGSHQTVSANDASYSNGFYG